jgi:hypothetical protein
LIKRLVAGATVALMVGLVCVSPAYPADQRSLSLSASKFDFAAEPGQMGSGEVTVINEGDAPISVRVYAADQVIAPDGSATYVVPAATANALTSPASWVTFELPPDAKSTGNIPFIDMPAGARIPVKFQVTVPEGAAPGDRQAVLFFEMYSPPGTTETPTARVNARIGARIETRVKGEVVEKVDVRPFTMPSFVVGSSPGYAFTVRNDGNVDARVDARLVVLDRSENELRSTVVLTDAPVYASSALEKKGVLQLPGPGIGPNNVRLVVSYTGDSGVKKTIEKNRTVWAVPMWLLVAFGVGLLVLLLAGVWAASGRAAKRRIRRDTDTADAARQSGAADDPDYEE